eukprot:472039_1
MVYLDVTKLGWEPFAQSWLSNLNELDGAGCTHLWSLFEQHVLNFLDFKKHECVEPIPITDFNAVRSLCNLFKCLATKENGVDSTDEANYLRMVEMYFLFSLVWSCGAAVNEESRKKVDEFLRSSEANLPPLNSVYDYCIDGQKKIWVMWHDRLQDDWRPPSGTPFYKIMVPTVDTIRNQFVIASLVASQHAVAAVGSTGTGKTAAIATLFDSLDTSKFSTLTINFSSATKSVVTQSILESRLVKHHGDDFVPSGGKPHLVLFVDDLNMPQKDEFGSQPPLELLRQWLDYEMWYNLQKQTVKNIHGMQLIAAMAPPGGGRSVISARLQSRLNIINFTFPDDVSVKRIFSTIITDKLNRENFDQTVKPLGEIMTEATLELYEYVVEEFL